MRSSIFYLFLLFLLFFVVSSCSKTKTFQKTEVIMGTTVSITIVQDNAVDAESAIDSAMAELRRLDAMMSDYKETSEVSGVNRAAGKTPVHVSPEMIEIVEAAVIASRISDGAFDVTIAPLAQLWRTRLKEGRVPTDAEIANARALVNYRDIVIDKNASCLFLRRSGMRLDFGGMKGYMADRIVALLKKKGTEKALVALAGDICGFGLREDGKPWTISIQHPRERNTTLGVVELSNKCISTSGDYERFVITGNERYHHILDPRTGRPSKGVISATVVGERGAFIDPMAKAMFIHGAAPGLELASKYGLDILIVDEAGRLTATAGIRQKN